MASSEDRTLYIKNLNENVTEEILFELFLQAGPLESVRVPNFNGKSRGFGFVEFKHEVSVPYAARLFYQTSLYGRRLHLQLPKTMCRRTPAQMMHTLPNNFKSLLGPPIKDNNYHPKPSPPMFNTSSATISPKLLPSLPLPLPATANRNNHQMHHKRMPSHLLPSPAKKRIHDQVIDKNLIPDSLDFKGLISGKSENDSKKKYEKTSDDLRSKIKKKKKKRNKEHSKKPNSTPERLTTTTTTSSTAANRGAFSSSDSNYHHSKSSYVRNAVNHIKQHCSRNNRGNYDFSNAKNNKLSNRHIRFNDT